MVRSSDKRISRDMIQRIMVAMADYLYQAGLAEKGGEGGRMSAMRWTATGAAAFRGADEPAGPAAPEEASPVVQPSGEIIASGGIPFEELRAIARASEVRSVDAAAVFALTRASLLRAAQEGHDLARLKEILASRSKTPLPQPVAFLIDEISSRIGEVEIIPCSAIVKARDPVILKTLGDGLVPISEGEVTVRGGRRHVIFVDEVDDDRVEGWDRNGGRNLSISIDSLVSARLVE